VDKAGGYNGTTSKDAGAVTNSEPKLLNKLTTHPPKD
jgi:hypothetical protein